MSHAVVDGPEVVLAATQQVYVVYVIRESSSIVSTHHAMYYVMHFSIILLPLPIIPVCVKNIPAQP